MPEQSPRLSWPFPGRDDDPWFDGFVDFVRALDATGFAHREDRNLILAGGGTLTWDASGSGLTWSEDFLVFSPTTGFFTRLVADSLAPDDGQVIRAEIVRAPGSNRNVSAEVAGIALNTNDSMLLGIRIGDNFFFRNGAAIKDGVTVDAIDLFSGSGGGGGAPGSIDWKDSCRAVTTGLLPAYMRTGNVITADANGPLPVQDGVSLNVGDSLLVNGQTLGEDNGVYVIDDLGSGGTKFVMTRRDDFDADFEVTAGIHIPIEEGTLNGGTVYRLLTTGTITINVTSILFGRLVTGKFFSQTFNSTDLVGGVLSVNHALDASGFENMVGVVVKNGSTNKVVQPDDIEFVDADNVDIDLGTLGVPAAPDWAVFVVGGA